MKRFTLAALVALGFATAPLPSFAQADVSVFIGAAPPPPLVERVPPPRHGYVWAPGHWEWNGRRHVWAPGVWIVERPGYAWSAPVWVHGDRGWYMQPGRWAAHGPDRNRDGIPDRYEGRQGGYYTDRGPGVGYKHGGRVDEDHDGVPNRVDRDRDGDGVPNRYDSRPDNPTRR
jgi:hypothetical protein